MKTLKKFGLIIACFATIVCAWQIYNYFYAPVIPKSKLQKVPKGYSDIVIFVDFKEPSAGIDLSSMTNQKIKYCSEPIAHMDKAAVLQ